MCVLLIPASLVASNSIVLFYLLFVICNLAPVLMTLGATINCSSNMTAEGSAVTVMCSYDSAMYSGYSVCILNQMELFPKCISSTESGSMVTVNGTVNGEHEVFVNPTWTSSPHSGMLESPHRRTYILTNVAVTSISTTSMSSAFTIWQMYNRLMVYLCDRPYCLLWPIFSKVITFWHSSKYLLTRW